MNWQTFFFDTDRLHVRLARPADAKDLQSLMTAGISRWVASWPYPLAFPVAQRILHDALAKAAEGRALPMVIVEKSSGTTIGWIKIDIETSEPLRTAELGYWLSEEAQGKGFAYEAASAAIAACFERLQIDIVEAGAQAGNDISHNLLAKLGMHKAGERTVYAPARERHETCVFWRIERSAGSHQT